MKDVDPVKTQPRQAAFERCRDGVGDAAELAGRHADLGADDDVGRLQRLQDAAKVLFRFAVAVQHRGVEVVDAGGDRPRDGALLVGGIAAHHQSAHRAAAEAQHRELHSRAPKDPQLHRCSLRMKWRLCRLKRPLLNLSAMAGALTVPELTRSADIKLK